MDKLFGWFGLPGGIVLTALLSAFALVRALLDPTPVHLICFAAMAFSSAGDIFLAHLKRLTDRFKHCFEIGAVLFMISHVLYTLCYGMKLRMQGAILPNGGTVLAVSLGALSAATLITLAVRKERTRHLPLALIYLSIIMLNCATVLTFAWPQLLSSFSAVCAALGVLSFMLSDFIIGLGLAGKINRYDALIWWFYPIGQILLILGA